MYRYLLILAAVTALCPAGCGSSSKAPQFVRPSPLGETYTAPHTDPSALDKQLFDDKTVVQNNPLTLDTALSLALSRNKDLRATAAELSGTAGWAEQARLYPNPELSFEAEDFGGSGTAAFVSSIQLTTSLRQTVELGGKRRSRIAAADLESKLSAWSYEQARVSLITNVKKAFTDLSVAERRKADAEDMVRITRDVLDTFTAQMEAGKLTSIEINNAKIALSRADIESSRAKRDLSTRRAALCALWGGSPCDFSGCDDTFTPEGAPPSREDLLPLLAETPKLLAAEARIEKRKADIELEHSLAVPNVDLELGYRWINDPGNSAIVAGASVPLPLAHRNQGAIKAAEAALTQATLERDAVLASLTGSLIEQVDALEAAWTASNTLAQEVLPLAIETLESIREGSRLGRFGYLDMLKAEETLFQVREDLLGAVTLYYHALAEVEGILARPLSLKKNKPAPGIDSTNQVKSEAKP